MNFYYKYQIFLGLKRSTGSIINNVDINKFIINNVLNKCNNFTLTNNIGYYNGKKEKSLTLTVISNDINIYYILKDIAIDYKYKFNQDVILISCNNLIKYEKI